MGSGRHGRSAWISGVPRRVGVEPVAGIASQGEKKELRGGFLSERRFTVTVAVEPLYDLFCGKQLFLLSVCLRTFWNGNLQ